MPSTHVVTPLFREPVTVLLAAYPHVAGCSTCRLYAADALPDYPRATVLSATLAYHAGYHRADPLVTANEHFAVDAAPTLA